MGGGCACNNLKENFFSPNSNIPLENYHNRIEQINVNNEPNKSNLIIFSNILDNTNEKNDLNKRYSDFHNYEKKNFEKHLNMKYNRIKSTNIEGKNTSCNETNNKRISSNFNSSNFFGSNIGPTNTSKKNNEIIEEEENNNNKKFEKKMLNIENPINENNKHNSIVNKIKKKEDGLKKAETNINNNIGENNYIYINISRGSSLMNSNEIEKYESTTPKMMLEKDNLEEIFKGNKKLFSHLCKKNLNDKAKKATNKNVYIHIFDMNKYNEEMLFIINKIRTNPESFIKDIDYLINNNIKKTEEGIFIVSHDVDEKIKLMDNYMVIFENVKKILKEMADSQNNTGKLEEIKYNDELEIIFDESAYEEDVENEKEIENSENEIKNIPLKLNDVYEDNGIDMGDNEEKNLIKYNDNINIIYCDNDNENKILKDFKIKKRKRKGKRKRNINKILDLNDDKIANLILQKRKEIKNDYPHNIFKLSVIKDIKINILVQIGLEEFYKSENTDKNTLKEIIFSPEYKNFGVSWTNEINRNFVSIACFA